MMRSQTPATRERFHVFADFFVAAYFRRLIAHKITASKTTMPIRMAVVNMRASLIWKSEPPAAARMDNLRTAAVVPAHQKDGRFLSVPARPYFGAA
jgi:hypothetical protein